MLKGLVAAIPLLALALPMTAHASEADDYAAFGEFLNQFRRENHTPAMSAVIVRDGAIAWEGYFGTYDDEGDLPTIPETTYKIASTTKPIAATAILAESLAGKLDLATPMATDEGWADICGWLSTSQIPFGGGGLDPHGEPIPAMDCSRKPTIADMLDMRVNGEAFVYNPISFARLDRAIEGAGGRDLRSIVRERAAAPAGMQDAALGWRDPEGGAALRYLAEPFYFDGENVVKQPLPDDDFRAAAGIIASPRQMAAFDIAYDAGKLLPPEYRRHLMEMEIPEAEDYRQGWFLEDWQGHRLMWHSGWNERQYSAMYLKVPGDRLTLIVLANTEAIWWDNSPIRAEIQTSPVAKRFLETFVGKQAR